LVFANYPLLKGDCEITEKDEDDSLTVKKTRKRSRIYPDRSD
jgi:hypothetical protein